MRTYRLAARPRQRRARRAAALRRPPRPRCRRRSRTCTPTTASTSSGYYVVSRYHPDGALPPLPLLRPGRRGALPRGRLRHPSRTPACLEHFDFHDWHDGDGRRARPVHASRRPGWTTRSRRTPCGSRPTTRSLVYSGDTGPTEALDELAAGADLFLCEASFVESKVNPPHLHLTGAQAGAVRDAPPASAACSSPTSRRGPTAPRSRPTPRRRGTARSSSSRPTPPTSSARASAPAR